MSEKDMLGRLLAGEVRDPQTGEPVVPPIRDVVVADSLAGREAELVGRLGFGRGTAVVCDPQTEAALGRRVRQGLAAAGLEPLPLVLPAHPHADRVTAEAVRRSCREAPALVAVGSGTINDLCKYASALDGKPYAVFGTAPSMNGYTSANASITVDGLKQSLTAHLPAGVFLDLEVLAAAPPRLIRAGLGDCLCRPTVQADWLLAHLLRGSAYRELPFALLAEDEGPLFARSDRLVAGDLPTLALLTRSLVLSGFGMALCGGSWSTSEGEHLISHYAEMLGPALPGWTEPLHGEGIGVTTLTMARIQETLLGLAGPPVVQATRATEEELAARFGADLGARCWRELQPKRLGAAAAEALNARLQAEWPAVRRRAAAVTLPAAGLEGVLRRAGAPLTAGDLGWSPRFYAQAVRHAREIRDRYTFLDLAADSGLLETMFPEAEVEA